MGLISCPLPCQTKKKQTDSDQSHNSKHLNSDSSSSSSLSSSSSKSLSSLYTQPSLPSVPSLTPPSTLDLSSNTVYSLSATFKAHSSFIFCLSLAGKHLYSGDSNGEILRWNKDPTRPVNFTVAQSGSAVKSLAVLGDKLFSAHQDHRIRVWRRTEENNDGLNQKYRCVATLPTLNDQCGRLFCAKNYVEVRRHKKCTWVHHVDTISGLALSHDCSVLYSVSWDRSFKVWRTSDFKCLESVQNAHDDAINAIALSSDGYVYTGSADKKIKIWKKGGGRGESKHAHVATLEKHKSAVNALALSTDGSVLYSGACDRSIIVWEKDSDGSEQMVVAGALRGHSKAILCLAVVADLICSGSSDKTVRIWKRGFGKNYSCLTVLEGHKGPVKCLTATIDSSSSSSKDGSGSGNSYVVYSGSLDCDIKVWKIWVPYL